MRAVITLAFALALSVGGAATPSRAQRKPEPEPPKEAAFRLKGLDGKTYESEAMRGEVLVVSFGATWCVPCTWELVAIEELKVEYAGKPVRFLWVSIEAKERTSDNILRHYAKERQLSIPVLRDPDASLFSLFSASTRIPLVVFYDREGRPAGPPHRGMSQDITVYKQIVRNRVNALLAAGGAKPAAEAGTN
ncbi:MAG TPA: TlpA disulfide reductase family protein [Pyrinomonadaceae bacterium]|nr:TlpA disulfide reductase family protein [Pyrinomonadaceae bacterium]